MKLVYVAHPYGGNPENAEAVKQIIEALAEGNHPLLANTTALMTPTVPAVHTRISITTTDLMQAVMYRRSISKALCTQVRRIWLGCRNAWSCLDAAMSCCCAVIGKTQKAAWLNLGLRWHERCPLYLKIVTITTI